jgi:uncharacterized membrane protein YbhN (UPF0104 family)
MRSTWLGLLLAVALLALLLSQTRWSAVSTSFGRLSPLAVVAGLALWALTNWLRARRFSALVHSREVPAARMFSIVNVQNLLATITPGRAGDLSYVVLLRQDGRVPGAEGLAGLVVARALDFVVAFGVSLGALLAVRQALPPGSGRVLATAGALFGLSILVLAQLAWISKKGVEVIDMLLRVTRAGKWRVGQRLAAISTDVHAQIVRVRAKGDATRLGLLTAGIWITSYTVSWIWIAGLALPLTFGQAMFVAAVAGLAASLPVQGIAGLGTTEAGWAIPLVIVGVGREQAIAAGFCFHALAIVYLAVLGGAGFLHLSRGRRGRAVPADDRADTQGNM